MGELVDRFFSRSNEQWPYFCWHISKPEKHQKVKDYDFQHYQSCTLILMCNLNLQSKIDSDRLKIESKCSLMTQGIPLSILC